MKSLPRVGLALVLTVAPTAILLAAVEDYTPPPTPNCHQYTDFGVGWTVCDMNEATGCGPADWSAQLNLQAGGSTGFASCVLATDGSAGPWELGLGRRNGFEHAGCGLYRLYRNQATRFVRCRSTSGATVLPTGFQVDFGKDATDCLTPTP
jgi:hypothetical protein